MSGVYIKCMDMPTTYPLTVTIYPDGQVLSETVGAKDIHGEAVLIPPHGRLIDADALSDVFRGFIAMYDSCPFNQLSISDKSRRDELQSALAEVIKAPTIIPVEEGEA